MQKRYNSNYNSIDLGGGYGYIPKQTLLENYPNKE